MVVGLTANNVPDAKFPNGESVSCDTINLRALGEILKTLGDSLAAVPSVTLIHLVILHIKKFSKTYKSMPLEVSANPTYNHQRTTATQRQKASVVHGGGDVFIDPEEPCIPKTVLRNNFPRVLVSKLHLRDPQDTRFERMSFMLQAMIDEAHYALKEKLPDVFDSIDRAGSNVSAKCKYSPLAALCRFQLVTTTLCISK
jgi:hypothetical protein